MVELLLLHELEDNIVSKQELEQVITETIIDESIETTQVDPSDTVTDVKRQELLKLKNSDLYEMCQEKGIKCTKKTNKKKLVELLLLHELEDNKKEVKKDNIPKQG